MSRGGKITAVVLMAIILACGALRPPLPQLPSWNRLAVPAAVSLIRLSVILMIYGQD
jgi:hypothetical protein